MNVKIYKEQSEDKFNNYNIVFLLNRYWPKNEAFFGLRQLSSIPIAIEKYIIKLQNFNINLFLDRS